MAPRLIPVRQAHQIDLDRLTSCLTEAGLDVPGDASLEQFAGGQSNPTYLLSSGATRLVVRKKPPGKLLPSAHLVEREYQVLRALADSDVPVPRVHLLIEDPAVIGTAFYVMDYVEGRVFTDPLLSAEAPRDRAAIYGAMNDALAGLHKVDFAACGLDAFGKPAGYIQRQVRTWTKQYRASETEVLPAMEHLITWLSENPPSTERTSIVHGDYRLGNLLFHPERAEVAAVLDWELSTLGHPLSDLAYNCMFYHLPPGKGPLGGFAGVDLAALSLPTEDEYLSRYAERTGAAVADWSFFLAFAFFRLSAICQGVYKRGLDGNASDAAATQYGAVAHQLAKAGAGLAS